MFFAISGDLVAAGVFMCLGDADETFFYYENEDLFNEVKEMKGNQRY